MGFGATHRFFSRKGHGCGEGKSALILSMNAWLSGESAIF